MSSNQRYKIKVNQAAPSETEVNEHKSFKRVLAQYRRTSKREPLHAQLVKLNKLLPTLIMTIVLMIVIYYASVERKIDQNGEKAPTEIQDSTKTNPNLHEQVDSIGG